MTWRNHNGHPYHEALGWWAPSPGLRKPGDEGGYLGTVRHMAAEEPQSTFRGYFIFLNSDRIDRIYTSMKQQHPARVRKAGLHGTLLCNVGASLGTCSTHLPSAPRAGEARIQPSTYTPEKRDVPIRYGWVQPIASVNPFRLAFQQWIDGWKDVRRAKNLREVAGYLFAPPGWQPDGNGQTTEDLRKAKQDESKV